MKINLLKLFILILSASFTARAQQMIFGGSGLSKEEIKKISISDEEKSLVVKSLTDQIRESYILKGKAQAIISKLAEKSRNGAYKDISNVLDLSSVLTKDLRTISNDAHFNIIYNPGLYKRMEQMMNSRRGAQNSPAQSGQRQMRRSMSGWPKGKQNNYFFKEIEILEGNVGYIKLEKIPTLENAKLTVDAAMSFLGNSDAIILDLRNNPGGFAGFISYFMSYFFPEAKTLIFSRETSIKETPDRFYTEENLPGKRLDSIPLFVLINEKTGSAATNMAYNLQKHDRAKIVGVTTEKGIMGAHSAMPFPLTKNFIATVPIGRVVNAKTGTNWNHTGVVPDIRADEDAKNVAHESAKRAINFKPGRQSGPTRRVRSSTSVRRSDSRNVKTNRQVKRSSEAKKASELLSKMIGDWKIEYNMRMNPNGNFRKGVGEATFTRQFGSEQIKESFKLGGRFQGEAFINFAQGHKRFELFQIDMMSSRRSTIYLVGQTGDSDDRLNFRAIGNHPQWGQDPFEIRWEYIFYKDGSFKKEMYSKGKNGQYYLQSDYHYKKK